MKRQLSTNHFQPHPDDIFNSHYYDTQLSTQIINSNNIMRYATPIINFINHLCFNSNKYTKSAVEEILNNEIIFFNQQITQHYKAEIVMAAQHVICSWCHEVIFNSSWGKRKKWPEKPKISNLKQESWQGENFYKIIQLCAQKPDEYQDLLQLCYYTMNLGYQGCYRNQEDGHISYYTIIDRIWDLIANEIAVEGKHLRQSKKNIISNYKPKIIKSIITILTTVSVGIMLMIQIQMNQITKPITNYFDQSIQFLNHNE